MTFVVSILLFFACTAIVVVSLIHQAPLIPTKPDGEITKFKLNRRSQFRINIARLVAEKKLVRHSFAVQRLTPIVFRPDRDPSETKSKQEPTTRDAEFRSRPR